MTTVSRPGGREGQGFRGLRVVAKERESSIISSLLLEPVDADGWRDFRPGQFLVFRLPRPGGEGTVLRNYSVSCSPARRGLYRITVKREAAPSPGFPAGEGSGFLHDGVAVGDVLFADGPRGAFVLDAGSGRPVVLLSGGVGLTPLVSMLHELSVAGRRTWFIHACDSGDVHALRKEVEALARDNAGIIAHFCYRSPTEADRAAGLHYSEGVVTRELLQRLLPLDDYDFYLCGPPPFMKAVFGALRGLGVPAARIAYEFFGPATLLEGVTAAEAETAPAASAPVLADGETDVEFRKSGLTVPWDGAAESLLDLAEDNGLSPEFSCRAGICGTCRTRLLAGAVDYFEEPLDEPPPGEILLCCSRPRGPVALDL